MSDQPDNVDARRGPTASQAAGLTLAAARRAIAAVEREASAMRIAMSVAVVDSGAPRVAVARLDGAALGGGRRAPGQADAARLTRQPTRDLAPVVQPGTEFYGYDSVSSGRMIVFAGGMPLERDDVLLGALGVSGGTADEDQRAADAAVEAFGAGSGT